VPAAARLITTKHDPDLAATPKYSDAAIAIKRASSMGNFFEEVARHADKNRDRMMDAAWVRKAIEEADLAFGIWRDEARVDPQPYPGIVIKGEKRLNTYVRLMHGIDTQGLSLQMRWVAIPCPSRDWAAALRCVLGDGLETAKSTEIMHDQEKGTTLR
jgi:hypothetical protein